MKEVNGKCDVPNAYAYHIESGRCTAFTQPTIVANATQSTRPSQTPGVAVPQKGGVSLTYKIAGSTCRGTGEEKAMRVSLLCDPSKDSMSFIDQWFFKQQCTIELRYASKMGCPSVQQGAVGQWIEDHKMIVAPALIALGIVMTFFGHMFVQALTILFIFSTVAFGCSYGGLVLLDKLEMGDNSMAIYGVLGASVILGLCLGFCLKNFVRTGMGIIGGVGGSALGVMLTQVLMISSNGVHMAIVFGMGFAGCLLGFWISKGIIVFVSSFLGAYMTVRGISMFAGGYPNEMTLAQMIKMGHITWENFPKIFFAYLAGIFVLTLIGIFFQLKNKKSGSQDERRHSNSASTHE